jgi:antitoxin component HigA of HigAB toxin-antitoxin module
MKIKTEEEYEKALHKLLVLMDAEPGTDKENKLIALAEVIEAYEDTHYPFPEYIRRLDGEWLGE